MEKNREYYTEELEKLPKDKIQSIKYQKYFTGAAIILMFAVLITMYFILS